MITVKNIIDKALEGRDSFTADNGHVKIYRKPNGEIWAAHDANPGYAVPSPRDRWVKITPDLLPLGEYDLPEASFLFWPRVLEALGL